MGSIINFNEYKNNKIKSNQEKLEYNDQSSILTRYKNKYMESWNNLSDQDKVMLQTLLEHDDIE